MYVCISYAAASVSNFFSTSIFSKDSSLVCYMCVCVCILFLCCHKNFCLLRSVASFFCFFLFSSFFSGTSIITFLRDFVSVLLLVRLVREQSMYLCVCVSVYLREFVFFFYYSLINFFCKLLSSRVVNFGRFSFIYMAQPLLLLLLLLLLVCCFRLFFF